MRRIGFLAGLGLLLGSCGGGGTPGAGVSGPDYNFDVRPILADNCFGCHGPDSGHRKAGLRLDIPEGAYAELPESPGKHAIKPGDPRRSELVRRIQSTDPDVRMPPASTHKLLTADQVTLLTRWVEAGAKYQPHWAYVTPARVRPPRVEDAGWVRNPVDAFVIDRLARAGLQPSPEADRETLVNRVTRDLTGLPPTLAEIDAFVADKRADAYERLVDRLLASPRYGEQMATQWLDVARYADSDGFLDDLHGRLVWPWRDWVIGALNDNMPYDRFVTWQLAGDLFPGATRPQRLATAFGRLGKRSTENGLVDEEYRVEYMNERAELVGKAFLGLTVGCAKCHDHKYDTISAEDYYSLGAFFNNVDERGFYAAAFSGRSVGPTLPWADEATLGRLDAARRALDAAGEAHAERVAAAGRAVAPRVAQALARPQVLLATVRATTNRSQVAAVGFESDVPATAAQVERDVKRIRLAPISTDPRGQVPAGSSPVPSLPNALVPSRLSATPDGIAGAPPAYLQEASFRDGVRGRAFAFTDDNFGFVPKDVGRFERSDPFSLDFWMRMPGGHTYADAPVVYHRDHNILSGDSGYTVNLDGNRLRFDLIHMSPANLASIRTTAALPADQWVHVTATHDGSGRAGGMRLFVDGVPASTETLRDSLSRTILPTGIAGLLGGDFYGLTFGRRFRSEVFAGGALDELRVFDRALTPLEVAVAQADARGVPVGAALTEAAVRDFLAATDEGVIASAAALQGQRRAVSDAVSALPEVLVMGDAPTPRQAFLLTRGVYSQHGIPVEARGPDRVFAWPDSLPRNRLGLAQWLFDPRHPLTARVTVNRLWAQHFGRGIVETTEDFGTQGAKPTHPELLDCLAVEFRESGWDQKALHRLIVTSSTYRQASAVPAAAAERDPRNQWLSYFPRRRQSAEMLRDGALSAGGLLAPRIGGPSAFPYQPAGVWEATASRHVYPAPGAVPADEHHRRSLYTFVKRSASAPSMVVFDFADRNVSTVRRPTSNTPLQALVLLNDPQYREAYRAMAEQALREGRDVRDRLQVLFRLATRRTPAADELDILQEYYDGRVRRFRNDPEAARALTGIGVSAAASAAATPEMAALAAVAAAVMNTPDAYSLP